MKNLFNITLSKNTKDNLEAIGSFLFIIGCGILFWAAMWIMY